LRAAATAVAIRTAPTAIRAAPNPAEELSSEENETRKKTSPATANTRPTAKRPPGLPLLVVIGFLKVPCDVLIGLEQVSSTESEEPVS